MNLLPLFVIIPLGSAFLMLILTRIWRGFPDWIGNLCTGSLALLSLWAIRLSSGSPLIYAVGGWDGSEGVCGVLGILLVMDGLTVLMLLAVNILGFLVTLYSISYMEHYTDKGKYYTLFILMMAGLNGVVISGDMFNLFVFLEITAIASYALVAYGVEAGELEASFKYQVLGGVASILILFGIAIFYHLTGTLNLADASRVLSEKAPAAPIYLVSALFIAGFGLKAAIMPFHAWLPDAHPSAPASISAMLSGVVIKILGIYALCRLFFNVIGITPVVLKIFMILGAVSLLAGVFLALGQWDLKRLLAYHSISQIGYVILGIGLGTELGILGGLFHLMNHTVFKSLLFLNAGSIEYATGTRNLKRMGGLQKKMPVTSGTSLIASFSIAGLPPFNGFWSKLIIIIACIQAGHPVFAVWAVIGSVMTLASFLKVQRYAFSGQLKDMYHKIREVPVSMCIPMIVLAALAVGMGLLLIPSVRAWVLDPAVKALLNAVPYVQMTLGG